MFPCGGVVLDDAPQKIADDVCCEHDRPPRCRRSGRLSRRTGRWFDGGTHTGLERGCSSSPIIIWCCSRESTVCQSILCAHTQNAQVSADNRGRAGRLWGPSSLTFRASVPSPRTRTLCWSEPPEPERTFFVTMQRHRALRDPRRTSKRSSAPCSNRDRCVIRWSIWMIDEGAHRSLLRFEPVINKKSADLRRTHSKDPKDTYGGCVTRLSHISQIFADMSRGSVRSREEREASVCCVPDGSGKGTHGQTTPI